MSQQALYVSNPFLFDLFSKVSINLFESFVFGSIAGRVISSRTCQSIVKIGFVRILYPYPIPGEEGDGGSLIIDSAMGDLN